ncbi:DUF2947 domain-containing protein [Neptunomonas phycophila]|jgi:hypothetical protein|uniref:DUF2947 domain-containing protein n=1 Tax=Neptunomonas phycophila TaxID=1572645 RepID=A0ABT9ERQ9_9GAMM|nr:DUF2947 domain-containing protein [Neptunomonas phycophila]MDP2521754.1 DUF2947 domain-containing protein [Neptunomonas phycophila]
MNYLTIDQYRHAWFYRHQDMPVPASDVEQIKPMTPARSRTLWETFISKEADFPEDFGKGEWVTHGNTWLETDCDWQTPWESEDQVLPSSILEHLLWDDGTVVYFCYAADHVVETRWGVFKKYWKNFLFMDDGPLLIGKRRKEVVQFFQTGRCRIGNQP